MTRDQNLNTLNKKILKFNQARDWEKYHSPKNLVMDLASEVGELIEPFRWLTEEQSKKLDPITLQMVKEELGDVFRIIVYLAHKLGIDPIEAASEKLEEMDLKYPIDQCYGRALKYTAYQRERDDLAK